MCVYVPGIPLNQATAIAANRSSGESKIPPRPSDNAGRENERNNTKTTTDSFSFQLIPWRYGIAGAFIYKAI